MKKLLILISIGLFVGGCMFIGDTSSDSPFSDLEKKAKKMRDSGAVAIIGRGSDNDDSFAKRQAMNDAKALASEFNKTKVETMDKLFRESVGMAGNNEQSKHWVNVTKTVSVSALEGLIDLKSKVVEKKVKNRATNTRETNYKYAVLMYISPTTYQKSIEDALAKEAAANQVNAQAAAEVERLKQIYTGSGFQEDLKKESAAFEEWLKSQ